MIEPCRTSCYDFRDRAAKFIDQAHEALLAVAMEEGLLDASEGVLDGTYFRSNASRHRMVNREKLMRRIAELEAAIAGTTAAADIPAWIGKTPAGRVAQLARLRRAEEILQRRLENNAKKRSDHRLPEKRVLVSPSDPEAPISKDKEKVFGPLYNTQYMVEPQTHLILAFGVFAQASDVGTIECMIDRTRSSIGASLQIVHADAAYASILDIKVCIENSIDLMAPVHENGRSEQKKKATEGKRQISKDRFTFEPERNAYECPEGHFLDYQDRSYRQRRDGERLLEFRFRLTPEICQACPLAAQCLQPGAKCRTIKRLEGQELLDAQRTKMTPETASKSRRIRSQTVERAFADVKEHRKLRRLHGRGLARAKAEIGLNVLAQNALTLFRVRATQLNPAAQTT
ncbi:MAG TPA: transposase [Chthoniobacterales bacterium]|nr:transposase [Chthoniobacterales bacterium]